MIPRSSVSHVTWPALPSDRGALMLSMQYQLSESEWLPPEELERRQMETLHRLLTHACRTVPYYRDHAEYAAVAEAPALTAGEWRRLPLLTRAALQDAGPALRSEQVPAGHDPVREVMTTGSTGRPVRGLTTQVTRVMWISITLREMLWHSRDFSGTLAAIRADRADRIPPEGVVNPNWGMMIDSAFPTGPCVVLSINHDVKAQAEWLIQHNPDYLLTYPSNVVALAHHFRSTGASLPRLREVSTYGEALTPEVRYACRMAWDAPVVDMYSAQEIGYIALQCPQTENYHVQSETVYVEVLDDDGRPCVPGEVGRVVISSLHNYAMPFLRYEIGDYAEVGERCSCARGLPVLTRVAGRQRNMWTLPGGKRVWPMFSSSVWGHIDAIRQLQLVQHAVDHIEARIVCSRPLTGGEESEFESLLRAQFNFPFQLTITYLDSIDRQANRKFEDFVSLVPYVP